tara:strand:- start:3461 stop:5311 length:1851 start_codon:yes stop_codon:yes gene_type:complete
MSELREILREEYLKQIQKFDLNMLLEMIEEELNSPVKTIKEYSYSPPEPKIDLEKKKESQQLQMLLNLIPDIAVSEIGWSDVTTTDTGEIIDKGPQRRLLEGYLSNVKGGSLKEKIAKVSSFYSDGIGLIEQEAGSDRIKTIVQAISYLVFYKTLTKVITNFNASSAGFSFESFLAVLCDGYQIPANTGTIADYVDNSEEKMIPVSLKLYREGGLEVGGSWKDLVNDLTMEGDATKRWAGSFPYAMRYVVCTKTLEGDDLEQEGNIHFYQFDFTLNNVMNILINSGDISRKCIRLPAEVVNAVKRPRGPRGMENYMNDILPSQTNLPSAQELEQIFINGIEDSKKFSGLKRRLINDKVVISEEQIEDLLQALSFAKNDDLFLEAPAEYFGKSPGPHPIVRGLSKLNTDEVARIFKKLEWPLELKKENGRKAWQNLAWAIAAGNTAVIASVGATKQKDKRKAEINRMLAAEEFLSPEASVEEYNMLGIEQKRMCLLNSLGYLRTFKFHISQTQVLGLDEEAKFEDLGSIEIGRKKIAEMLGKAADLLNKEVGEIFQALADLSESLNLFFANLDKDVGNSANVAISSAQSISKKNILVSKKKADPEQATQMPLPGIGE